MVNREKGESGDDAYRINAKLVHAGIIAILGSTLSIAGYMTLWAIGDAQWKATINERMTNFVLRLADLEQQHIPGVHPIARERIEQLDRRMRELEAMDRERTGRGTR